MVALIGAQVKPLGLLGLRVRLIAQYM